MLKEFVDSIVALARTSAAPSTVDLPNNKMLLVVDGSVETLIKDRRTHSDVVLSLPSFIEWCLDRDDLVIKVSNDRIFAVSNRDIQHESDSAVLGLQQSNAYADLLDWCKTPRTVSATVKGLRTKLAGTHDTSYLSVFKRLDFTRKNDGSKSVTHTGESMGKLVEMAAQSGAGEIPEVLSFRVRLFAGLPVSDYDLRFAVNVDASTEVISIAPVGDCIVDAHQSTRVELVERLKAEYPQAMVLESA